jgi:hypothetical protein
MNEEQKQKAGLKIAAGAVIGGLAGHFSSDKSVVTGKRNSTGAVVGALAGAGIGAGSSYAGKVGGDMIMSAGVNAAAGGIVGNMAGGGVPILRIEDCKDLRGVSTTCLWGVLEKSDKLDTGKQGFFNIDDHRTVVCDADGGAYKNCSEERLVGLVFKHHKSLENGIANQNFLTSRGDTDIHYAFIKDSGNRDEVNTMKKSTGVDSTDGIWIPITSGGKPSGGVAAMIPNFKNKAFGVKSTEWGDWQDRNEGFAEIVGRNNKGEAFQLDGKWALHEFRPLMVDASDGSIIDVGNRARAKATMVGAGAGAGLGAFTAYQGAQDEISMRLVSAVQEYTDSLQKFYCATGNRWLAEYNSFAIIPNMSQQ